MSIIDTLITNRTQADVDALLALYAKPKAMWTTDEWNEFLLGNHRGAYNASDMNRVLDALDYLADRVTQFGYRKPEIKRPNITEVVPGTSRLPEGYTELEYIQSSGTEHVDTSVKLTNTSRVVMDADLLDYATNAYGNSFFGARSASNANAFLLLCARASAETWTFMFGSASVTGTATRLGRHKIEVNGNVCTIDGVTITGTAANFTCDHNCYLFTDNKEGSANTVNNSRLKLYSCQIYDNGTLIRDYVPCLNPSNEVGLYDIVNGEFYGNAGTGAFTAGEELESTGGTTTVRDYYAIGDRPSLSELAQYLDNVSVVRAVLELPDSVPEVPEDISQRITIDDANNIEIILTAVETLLNRIALSWVYSGEFTAGEV